MVALAAIVAATAISAYSHYFPGVSVLAYDPRRSEECDPYSFHDCNAGPVTEITQARNPFVHAIAITSVSDLVGQVQNFVDKSGRRVGTLTIADHGWIAQYGELNLGSRVEIGDDIVSRQNFGDYEGTLKKLRNLFGSNGLVELANCHAGQDPELLQKFANAVGVPVRGGTGKSAAHIPYNSGEWVTCQPRQ